MDALTQGVEVLAAFTVEQDDLAVEHVAPGRERQLGEVASHRLARPRLEEYVRTVDEDDRAEPVPLGLVDPLVARRQLLRRAGELREEGRLEGQRHGCPIKALVEGSALVEAGPVLGAELRSEDVDRSQAGEAGDDESQNGHVYIFGHCAPLS